MTERKQTLWQFSLLCNLNDAKLARRTCHPTGVHHSASTLFFPDRQIGDTFYLLYPSRVQVIKTTEHGDALLNAAHLGHHLEMGPLDNQLHFVAAHAVTDVTVIERNETHVSSRLALVIL